MNVVILAGGMGTRLAEETDVRPKPMVEIGGMPMLLHIMQIYAYHQLTNFIVAMGYKAEYIKRYFADPLALRGDMTVDLANGTVAHNGAQRNWRIVLADTGLHTMTGGRVRRLRDRLTDTFMLTYGDGVADVHVGELLRFHRRHGKLVTITAVRPPVRFGVLCLRGDTIAEFSEKPVDEGAWINGGFMVCEPEVIDYIEGDSSVFEKDVLPVLAVEGQVAAYRHTGFWQCVDTLHEKRRLSDLCVNGTPPWLEPPSADQRPVLRAVA